MQTVHQANRALLSHDYDVGSGGVLIVPGQTSGNPKNLLVQGGKEGDLFLVNRATGQMGGYSASGVPEKDNIVFEILGNAVLNLGNPGGNPPAGLCFGYTHSTGAECGMWSSPAWWNNGHTVSPYSSFVYVGPEGNNQTNSNGKLAPIIQYALSPGASGGATASFAAQNPLTTTETFGYPGITPVVSTQAAGATTALLWGIDNSTYANTNSFATVYAWDASKLGTSLWNSEVHSPFNRAAPAVKFTVPTVAHGKVYVGGYKQLTVYGQ